MNFKKLTTIIGAFLKPLPEDSDWYQKRLEICNSCPNNTKNIAKEDLTLVDRAKIKTNVCDNGNHCTLCGCCIERKVATMSEECAMSKIGEKPKWSQLSIINPVDTKVTVVNLTPEIGDISVFEGRYHYVIDNESQDPKVNFSISISRNPKLDVKTFFPSCSCTVIESEVINESAVRLDVSVSTKGFNKGSNTRGIVFEYFDSSNNNKVRRVEVKMEIKM